DRAMSDYDQAIRLDANNVSAYVGRCSVLIDKANYGNAIESCDQALKRQPNNQSARNNRCWARAILGPQEQLKQALEDCDEALRLRPNDPYAFDSRGFVYLKMGNYDKDHCALSQQGERARAATARDQLVGAAEDGAPEAPAHFARMVARLRTMPAVAMSTTATPRPTSNQAASDGKSTACCSGCAIITALAVSLPPPAAPVATAPARAARSRLVAASLTSAGGAASRWTSRAGAPGPRAAGAVGS